MKRTLLILVAAATFAGNSRAEVTRAKLEEAQKATLLLNNALGEVADAPFKLEVNAFKPCALKGEDETGALVVPVYSLKQHIEGARRKTPIPAGQLWLRKVVPLMKGKAAARDSLRLVNVKTNDGDAEVSMYHLAFQRFGNGGKLLIYGKGREPLLEIMLKPAKGSQETPIDLEAEKGGDGTPLLVFHVADKFEGRLPLAHAD